MPGSVLPIQAKLSNAIRSFSLRAWFNTLQRLTTVNLAHCQTFEGEFCPEGKFTLGSDIFSNNSTIAERYYPVSVTAH